MESIIEFLILRVRCYGVKQFVLGLTILNSSRAFFDFNKMGHKVGCKRKFCRKIKITFIREKIQGQTVPFLQNFYVNGNRTYCKLSPNLNHFYSLPLVIL